METITGDTALAAFKQAAVHATKLGSEECELLNEPIAAAFKPDFAVYRITQQTLTK